jgi:uncharacterized protein (DUF1499 family)
MRRLSRAMLRLSTLLAALGLGLRLYLDRPAENRLLPNENVTPAELAGRLPANAFLACPPNYCAASDAAVSPLFAVGADRLYHDLLESIASEPRIVIVSEQQSRRLVLIQRSALWRFPDIVTAEFVAIAPNRSSIVLYSRARYGRYDFGVNRRRVETWLARLEKIAPRQ